MTDLMQLDRNQWVTPLPQRDPSGGLIMVTSDYGIRWGSLHAGTDAGSTDGLDLFTSTHAMAAGKIDGRGDARPNSAGLWVWLRTVVRIGGFELGLKYFHLAEHIARVGDHVAKGEIIAKAGGSGGVAVHAHVQFHLLSGRSNDWTDETSLDNTPFIRALIAEGRFPGAIAVEPPAPPTLPPSPPATPDEDLDMLTQQPCYRFGEDGNPYSGATYWVDNAGRVHHVPNEEVLDRMSTHNQGHPPILAAPVWLDRPDFINQIRAYDPGLADRLEVEFAR